MKNVKNAILLAFIINLITINTMLAQNYVDNKNLETVINLTKFVKFQNNSYKISKDKVLYIIADNHTQINFEIKTSSIFNYKNWKIICSETINSIPAGSVIFLTTKRNDKIKKVINISHDKGFLTISNNIDDFCLIGGMINIKKKNNTLRFEINYKKILKNNMQIDSKLLALAKIYD